MRAVDRRCVALVTWFCVALSGCATPDAVRDFAKSARDVTSQFPQFAQDFADSCVRRKLADQKVTAIEDSSKLATTSCREDFDLIPDLNVAGDVLTRYLDALNRLASNGTVQYDKEVDGLASSLKPSVRLSPATIGAVQGLAKVLSAAVASGYQRKKLAEGVKAADVHVAVLTEALGHVVGVEYLRNLDNEESSLLARYQDAMRSTGNNDGIALLLQRQWRRDIEALQKKKLAAASYRKALEKVRDGHKQLALRSTHWSANELAKELGPYTTSIQSLASSISTTSF